MFSVVSLTANRININNLTVGFVNLILLVIHFYVCFSYAHNLKILFRGSILLKKTSMVLWLFLIFLYNLVEQCQRISTILTSTSSIFLDEFVRDYRVHEPPFGKRWFIGWKLTNRDLTYYDILFVRASYDQFQYILQRLHHIIIN